MFCSKCGTENPDSAMYCQNCGKQLKKVENEGKRTFDNFWYAIGILFPIIGIVGGIVFAYQGRDKAGTLILVSLAAWFIYAVILILI